MAMQITRKANRLAIVCATRKTPRCGGVISASGLAVSGTTKLVSTFESEVVIPNRTINRTDRSLFSATGDAHDPENYCFHVVARLERQADAIPLARAVRRGLRRNHLLFIRGVKNLNLRCATTHEFFCADVILQFVLGSRRHRYKLRNVNYRKV